MPPKERRNPRAVYGLFNKDGARHYEAVVPAKKSGGQQPPIKSDVDRRRHLNEKARNKFNKSGWVFGSTGQIYLGRQGRRIKRAGKKKTS